MFKNKKVGPIAMLIGILLMVTGCSSAGNVPEEAKPVQAAIVGLDKESSTVYVEATVDETTFREPVEVSPALLEIMKVGELITVCVAEVDNELLIATGTC